MVSLIEFVLLAAWLSLPLILLRHSEAAPMCDDCIRQSCAVSGQCQARAALARAKG